MKNIKDYLKENGNVAVVLGNRNIGFALRDDYIIVEIENGVATDIYELETELDIQDMMYDNYDIEVRFCCECGKPYDAGFMAGDGDYYCCEDCFEPMMDRDYGKDNWRATEEEGYYGGFYEYLDDGQWEDTGIYYTEWN